jgi:transcriptional regulator with XRE-family HTH domain
MTPTQESNARLCKEARLRLGVTQLKVCHLAGCSPNTVIDAEKRGILPLQQEARARLLAALGLEEILRPVAQP